MNEGMICDGAEAVCRSGSCTAPTPVDVTVLIDTTGSNLPDFTRDRATLQARLIEPLIANGAAVGASYLGEIPIAPYGQPGDRPFAGGIEPTMNAAAITSVIGSPPVFNGTDPSDAAVEALSALTGGAIHPTALALTCSAGREPGGCWRPEARRVIVVYTDSPIHNGPAVGGAEPFDPYDPTITGPTALWSTVSAGMRSSGTVVIWLDVMSEAPAPEQFRRALADLGQPSSDHFSVTPLTLAPACDAIVARILALPPP